MSYLPYPRLFMALGQNPLTLEPVWTPIDVPIWSWGVTRGRASDLALVEGGELKITGYNLDGALDSQYPGSPYFPDLLPGALLYLDVLHDGGAHEQFTGFMRGLPELYPGQGSFESFEITATDGFLRFGKKKVSVAFEQQLSGLRMIKLADDRAWPGAGLHTAAGWRSIDIGTSVMDAVELDRRTVREHMAHIETSECGLCYIARDGALTWKSRDALSIGAYANVQATFVGAQGYGPPGIAFMNPVSKWDDEGVYNEVTGSRVGGPEIVAEDTASAAQYGEASHPGRVNSLLTTDREVEDMVWSELAKRKDARYGFKSLQVRPDADSQPSDVWDKTLALDIGHRVRVFKRKSTRFDLDLELNLQRYDRQVSYRGSRSWTDTYSFSLSDPNAGQYWAMSLSPLSTRTRPRF